MSTGLRLILVSAALVALVLVVVLGVAVLGRATGPAAGDDSGDTLLLSYPNDPDTINPITANDTVSEVFQKQVYEYLADRDFANPDHFVPYLATSWEFDEKTLEYTIHLRRGVKWHPMALPNGTMLPETEFTAADAKFSYDCILNKHTDAAVARSYYEDPEAKEGEPPYKIKVSIVDKYTIKVRWTKPYFLSKEFTLGVPMIPRHVFSVDTNGEPLALNVMLKEFGEGFNHHWANTKMCGTGPMRFLSWKRNQRLTLVRNEDYWGKPFPFKRLVYQCIPNANTALQKLLQNDLDYLSIADKDQFLQCQEKPTVREGKVKLADYPYPGYRYVGYNMNREFFKDVRVRRAITHAIPVDEIIQEVFKGLAEPITGPFQPGSSAYDNQLPRQPYDLEAARRMLSEAGWEDRDHTGTRSKTIQGVKVPARFNLMIYADAASYRTIAEIIKENCRKIGVDCQVSPTKWALMLDKLHHREFDAAMLGWALSWKSDPFQIWHGSLADVPYSSNAIGYCNPQVDKLIERLRVTLDEKKQVALYREIHRLIYEDQPYAFLFADKATAGYDARLENIRFYKIRPCYDPREWTTRSPR